MSSDLFTIEDIEWTKNSDNNFLTLLIDYNMLYICSFKHLWIYNRKTMTMLH
jgi:hypothetical protein